MIITRDIGKNLNENEGIEEKPIERIKFVLEQSLMAKRDLIMKATLERAFLLLTLIFCLLAGD